jgi:hypothetical protein
LSAGALHAGEARGDVADLLALVADAFEVGDGLDDGDDDAQIARGRRARREDARALLVDRHFHAVDLEVVAPTETPRLLSPSMSAVTALASCCSTMPPMVSTLFRTRSRSSLKRREMWWEEIGGFHDDDYLERSLLCAMTIR